MRYFALCIVWILIVSSSAAPIEVVLLFTNDEHGELLPYDFIRQKDKKSGLAHCATLIKSYRQHYPNTLLLSAGDTYQGSPLAYYYHYQDSLTTHPLVRAMNFLRYDAWVPGNHDIEQGLPFLEKIEKETQFDCISANIRYAGTDDSLFFKPYTIKKVGGITLAILGLTTPAIPLWLTPDVYQGVMFDDMIVTARKWVKIIQTKENPDLVIGLFHSGLNQEWDSAYCVQRGIPMANPTVELARQVPDFDLIVCGHSHKLINDSINEDNHDTGQLNRVGKTCFAQARAYGNHLGICHFYLNKIRQKVRIDSIRITTESTFNVQPDSDFISLFKQEKLVLKDYINDSIGYAQKELSAQSACIHDNPLIDLIHSAQLAFSGAKISIASVFNDDQRIKPGKVCVGDIFRLYPYENTLIKTRMSGRQINQYLEYNARFFQTVARHVRELRSNQLFVPDIRSYNFDTIEGLKYTIDITQPVGNRITNLTYPQGQPVRDEDTLEVVMNSYRFSGGGGFISALNVKSLPLVESIPVSIRDLVIRYIRMTPYLQADFTNNWTIYPDSLQVSED